MRATCSILVLAFAALGSLAGCGGEARDATSKELSALTAEISKLRAEQAAMAERLEALERGKPRAPDSAAAAQRPAEPIAAPAAPSLDSDRPALDVVRLGPSDGDEEGDGDVDASGPRTVLRSGANGIVVEEQGTSGGAVRTVQPDPGAAKKPAAPPAPKKTEKVDRKKTASLPTP
jgi:hypothetical protein